MADWSGSGSRTNPDTEPKVAHRILQPEYDSNTLEQRNLELQRKRNLFLEEQARALMRQSKHFEASERLESMENAEDDHFRISLLKAECYIHLGRENKALKAIDRVKSILSDQSTNTDLLMSFGDAMSSSKSFLRSLVIYRIAASIIKNSTTNPDQIVEGIAKCIGKCQNMLADVKRQTSSGLEDILSQNVGNVAELLQRALKPSNSNSNRLHVIVLDFGVEYMNDMLTDLRAVQGASIENKALKEAWSLTHIAFILANEEEFVKSYKLRKEGTEILDRVFAERAAHHRVYGLMLHNMGIVCANSRKLTQAKELYRRAIEAKEMAIDYSGVEKQLDIEISRKSLSTLNKLTFQV